MNFLLQNKWYVLLVVGLAGLITGIYSLFLGNPEPTTKVATLDLQASFQNHPSWKSYSELQQAINNIRQKWGDSLPPDKSASGDSNAKNFQQDIENRQLAETENSFNEERNLRLSRMDASLRDYYSKRAQDYDAKLKAKIDSLNANVGADLQAKANQYKSMANIYRQTLETEQQLNLSNLQLQLSTIDFTKNIDTATAQKQNIQNQIDKIKQDIDQKANAKQQELTDQLKSYEKDRRDAANYEINAFKAQQETDFSNEVAKYKKQVETEFSQWEIQRTNELKKNLSLQQQFDVSQIALFQSQADEVKTRMQRDLQTIVKIVCKQEKVECVLQGETKNISLYDLTPKVIAYLKTGNWRKTDNDN